MIILNFKKQRRGNVMIIVMKQNFSEENLKKSGITKHFSNNDGLEDSVAAIKQEILRNIGEQKSRD